MTLQERTAKRKTDQPHRYSEQDSQTVAREASELSVLDADFQLVDENTALSNLKQGDFWDWLAAD